MHVRSFVHETSRAWDVTRCGPKAASASRKSRLAVVAGLPQGDSSVAGVPLRLVECQIVDPQLPRRRRSGPGDAEIPLQERDRVLRKRLANRAWVPEAELGQAGERNLILRPRGGDGELCAGVIEAA